MTIRNEETSQAMENHASQSKEVTPRGLRKIFPALFLLFWIEIIIAGYFWVHKPWPADQNFAPLMAVVDVLLAVMLVALAGGLGRFILRDRLPFSIIENATLQTAIGLGSMSILVLVAGTLGFLGVWQAWLALGAGVIIFSRHILAWWRSWRSIFNRDPQMGLVERVSLGLVVFLVILAGLQALAPPLKWDSLVYHLELPQRYLASGTIDYLDDNLFVGYPQLAEMLFTWAMALRAASTAAVLGWLVGLIAVIGVGHFAERLIGRGSRWIASAILLSGASISRGLSWAYVDLWVLLFGLTTTIALDYFGRTNSRVWVAMAGVFAGFALSTKYTAGMLLPLGVVFISLVWLQERRVNRWRQLPGARSEKSDEGESNPHPMLRLLETILIFLSVAIAVASPWLIKNTVTTGNPVYPFFFHGRGMDALRLSFYAGETPARTLFHHLVLPVEATIFGIEGGPIFNTSVSPLFLMLIPGLAIGWRSFRGEQGMSLLRLIAVVIFAWLIWALASQTASALTRTRHYYVVFPALVILACAGFRITSRLKILTIELGWLVRGLVMFVLMLTAIAEALFFARASTIRVLSGFQSREEYIAEQLGWFGPVMEAVNALPEEARVAFFWEPRTYYCRVRCSPDVILDRWWYLMRTEGTAHDIAALLQSQGFTHVLLYDLGVQLEREVKTIFDVQDWEELERFKEEELQLIQSFDETYSLFALPAASPD